jgi:TRAP-type C4-dicarboxylate transport system permease large subunit
LGERLYDLAAKWLGQLPGGIAIATVAGCAGLAAISADNLSPATTMSLVAYPEMKKYKYDPALSVASIAVGGTLFILIPPSAMFIT